MKLKHEELIKEIELIHSYGFSELEAIELLKIVELRELNKQLSDTLYISGDVTVYTSFNLKRARFTSRDSFVYQLFHFVIFHRLHRGEYFKR